jgi:two-component system phosphate regulon response regulator PhoB
MATKRILVIDDEETLCKILQYNLENKDNDVDIVFCSNEKPNVLQVNGLKLDLQFKRCLVDEKEVKMTKKEFEILVFLILHRGRICSREEILSKVWKGEVVVLDRTIDVNITRLRSKIGEYGGYIITRSGYGYGFRE